MRVFCTKPAMDDRYIEEIFVCCVSTVFGVLPCVNWESRRFPKINPGECTPQSTQEMFDEFDVVILKEDYEVASSIIPARTTGTIVHVHGGGVYEVELFDKEKNTIGVYTIKCELLQRSN